MRTQLGHRHATALALLAALALGCSEQPELAGLPFNACDGVVSDEALLEAADRERDDLELISLRGLRQLRSGRCVIGDGQDELVEILIESETREQFDEWLGVPFDDDLEPGTITRSEVREISHLDHDVAWRGMHYYPRSDDGEKGLRILVLAFEEPEDRDRLERGIDRLLDEAVDFLDNFQHRPDRTPSTTG